MFNDRSFMVCVSFFECVFISSVISPGLVILFVGFYCRYIQDVFIRQFPLKGQVFLLMQLHFWVFWFTGLVNIFLLCVLIFDLMLHMCTNFNRASVEYFSVFMRWRKMFVY